MPNRRHKSEIANNLTFAPTLFGQSTLVLEWNGKKREKQIVQATMFEQWGVLLGRMQLQIHMCTNTSYNVTKYNDKYKLCQLLSCGLGVGQAEYVWRRAVLSDIPVAYCDTLHWHIVPYSGILHWHIGHNVGYCEHLTLCYFLGVFFFRYWTVIYKRENSDNHFQN